ncbi:MAG: Hsp70 family protein [Spirochaetota bacterium]|nr:Hsp70 family protein [Spirochaetota bacterium]
MEKIFGIDLGTTNSEIAYLDRGKPVIIEIADGKKYLPSVVGLDRQGNIITGFTARNQYAAFPEDTVMSIKRKMGSSEKVVIGGRTYTPAEISSYILKTLKESAERETGIKVEKVVITVPAYFTDSQRSDTIKAGELAGLDVVRIINEPTAAALAYGTGENNSTKLLVYDLGGGTFDISLMDIEDDVVEVVATDGDSHLGGDDFNLALSDYFRSFLPKGAAKIKDMKLDARIGNISELVKIELSNKSLVKVEEAFLTSYKGKPVNLDLDVSRKEFEARIEDKLGKSFELLDTVIKAGGMKNSDIDKLILAGGSTHIPKIIEVLSDNYGFDVHREIDPYYCVVMGAAVQGGIIAGEDIDTILVDVNSHSLGISCIGMHPTGEMDPDFYSILIHKNTAIPSSMTRAYYTMGENQTEVQIDIYQGEDRSINNNSFIASFLLDNLPKNLPAGSEIDVTFEYNINGLIEISAEERKSGRKEKLDVDINRISQSTNREKEKVSKIDIRKVKRLIKTAKKKSVQLEDSEIKKEIEKRYKKLEALIDKGDMGGTEMELEELLELLSGV